MAACAELARSPGEASRIAVAERALVAYGSLDEAAKVRFFRHLLSDYGVDAEALHQAYIAWSGNRGDAELARLFDVVEPRRQELFRRLNHPYGATLRLVRMREDLLGRVREHPELAPLDHDFAHLFASWFNRGFLVMRRIDWNTPASILERIVAYEAVHEIRDWDDLRRRLEPADRRCYAFFHPATGDEPLIFVEVALCNGVPDAIGPLLNAGGGHATTQPDTAAFYSISNCHPGLRGVSFGNFLIKQVVKDLCLELPGIRTFVTLSPAPGFAAWLAAQSDRRSKDLSTRLRSSEWLDNPSLQEELRPQVLERAAQYLVHEKAHGTVPLDPVARFHIGNGAAAHRINWPADLAPGALERSHGLMINYLYELSQIEKRHESFVADGTIAVGPQMKRIMRQGRERIEKEKVAK